MSIGHVQVTVKPTELTGRLTYSRDYCWLCGASSMGDFVGSCFVAVFSECIKNRGVFFFVRVWSSFRCWFCVTRF